MADNLQMFLKFVEVDNSAAIVVQFITVLCFRYHWLDVLSSACMGPFQVFTVSHATLILLCMFIICLKYYIQGLWIPGKLRKVNICSDIKE